MILIGKPHKAGAVSTGEDSLVDLIDAQPNAPELLQAIDFGQWGNPDGASGRSAVSTHPNFMGGHPQGALRSNSVSGQGAIHPTNRTSAPMGKPAGFNAGPNSVKTSPMTIAK